MVDLTWRSRVYPLALRDGYSVYGDVLRHRADQLEAMHGLLDQPGAVDDAVSTVFDDPGQVDRVRWLNRVPLAVQGTVAGFYLVNSHANLFVLGDDGSMGWYKFDTNSLFAQNLLTKKTTNGVGYAYFPEVRSLDFFQLDYHDGDFFKFVYRDLTKEQSENGLSDSFALRCKMANRDGSVSNAWLWYLAGGSFFAYCPSDEGGIEDMAYEQFSDTLYVLFSNDERLYVYVGRKGGLDSMGRARISKSDADYVLDTHHSTALTDRESSLKWLYLDYSDAEGRKKKSSRPQWELMVWGEYDGIPDVETFGGSPGLSSSKFVQSNLLCIGDSLFDADQLKFQQVSKNKDMYQIIDVDEVDGRYYGLFKDYDRSNRRGSEVYTLFRTPESSNGVVERLPWAITVPQLHRSADQLYSIWVVEQETPGSKVQLREVSVPDNEVYQDRTIPIQELLGVDSLDVQTLVMSAFQTQRKGSSFFVLDPSGMHRVWYTDWTRKISLDTMDSVREALAKALREQVLAEHLESLHEGTQAEFFQTVRSKVNQFGPDFGLMDYIPAEFAQTQVVGVVPDGEVHTGEEAIDHRLDSIQASTDVLPSDGYVLEGSQNPGMVSIAVSNPATAHDDDTVYGKAQRNPELEGTGFYDYVYVESTATALLDGYAIPFIYKVHTNNTYDLYVQVPTTLTKYLNRVAGTLTDDLTTRVLADDVRTRVNFNGESLPNNLTESTTLLRLYVDRKFIGIGSVDLVEICGNSLPMWMYRDSGANSGLYDSIALESRWTGEVEEIVEPSKDVNKLMLEFECYGTDSQSIHLSGKTLVNPYLDDSKYGTT